MIDEPRGVWAAIVRGVIEQRVVVVLLLVGALAAGLLAAPFDLGIDPGIRSPVAVDAIPDTGENQQIVVTTWAGHSPEDVDDQITYPLTVRLLGLSGVTEVRGSSMIGLSSIYVVFDESISMPASRARLVETLSSLRPDELPEGVQPRLGPEATALGQVFWYTLEGRTEDDRPSGGWSLHELRRHQDEIVAPRLSSIGGVAEVASIGGYEIEVQVDVDPFALRVAGVTLGDVVRAVRRSNRDVSARTIEVNRAEFVVRGLGALRDPEDLAATAVVHRDGVPILLGDLATITTGPGPRRGALTKAGREAVGGVVVVQYDADPNTVLDRVEERIASIAGGLPSKVLEDGSTSRLTIVPFYDRRELIDETLGTLSRALEQQILVTVAVVVILLGHVGGGLAVASLLPLTVILTFAAMRLFGVGANVVALAGIAIAVGTVVDMGIVLVETLVRRAREAAPGTPLRRVVVSATGEVAGAVTTAVLTTVVSFLPVFTMVAAEGKLFRPLAYTKTFALLASILLTLTLLPLVAGPMLRAFDARRLAARVWRGLRVAIVVGVLALLAWRWQPLGPTAGLLGNGLFHVVVIGFWIAIFLGFRSLYPRLLRWALDHKALALAPAVIVLVAGGFAWRSLDHEFMPPLDEGAFLYMPTTMPHASMAEALDVVGTLDRAILSVPEVETAIGKIGRVDSALDPAPISMVETLVTIRDEYGVDERGHPVRQWRDEIRTTQDVWNAIVEAARLPGTTSAPRLQPIEARRVMLQSGFRAPMGLKIFGPDLVTLEDFGQRVESVLRGVPEVASSTVFADRVVGKPYVEIDLDRARLARHGVSVEDAQEVIAVAIGGVPLTTQIDGRSRFPVRVRYARELRDDLEDLGEVLVTTADGASVPLRELATIETRRGPQMIRSEDSFLVSYVLFDRAPDVTSIEAIEAAGTALDDHVARGFLEIPDGVTFEFAGSYENELRASARLRLMLPVALGLIVILLHLQFRSLATTALVFSGVFVAWAGGFVLLWVYGQPWWLDSAPLGIDLRDVFGVTPVAMSVAVWIGFLALFGIATDDGVVMATRIRQALAAHRPTDVASIRAAVHEGASQRIAAAVITSATTVIALLPVLTSPGRGAEIMVPMALPTFGGMLVAVLTTVVVPVLHCAVEERRLGDR